MSQFVKDSVAATNGNVEIQKCGLVYKLPWSGKAKAWKRRYFVVKDGYMMYYNKSPAPGNKTFNIHPKGILPLGETTVEEYVPHVKPPPGHYAFRVTHPSFGKGSLVACVDSRSGLDQWIQVLKDSSRVTWEAAVYGDSLINQLRERSAEMVEKHQQNMEKAKRDAEEAIRLQNERENAVKAHAEALKAAEEKKKAIEDHMATTEEKLARKGSTLSKLEVLQAKKAELAQAQANLQQKHEEILKSHTSKMLQLEKTRSHADKILKQKKEADLQLEKTKKEGARLVKHASSKLEETQATHEKYAADLEEAQARRLALETSLADAEESLRNLDAALRKSGVKVNIDVAADVTNLRSFFEEKNRKVQEEREELERKIKYKGKDAEVLDFSKAIPEGGEEEEEEEQSGPQKNAGEGPSETANNAEEHGGFQSSDDEADEGEDEFEISEEVLANGKALFLAISKTSDAAVVTKDMVMDALQLPRTITLDDAQKNELFVSIDQNNNGKISIEEFIAYFGHYSDYLYDVFDHVVTDDMRGSVGGGGNDWHYLDSNGDTLGPFATGEFVALYKAGKLTKSTHVWSSDLDGWQVVEDVPNLLAKVSAT
jgi:hypothetical protein